MRRETLHNGVCYVIRLQKCEPSSLLSFSPYDGIYITPQEEEVGFQMVYNCKVSFPLNIIIWQLSALCRKSTTCLSNNMTNDCHFILERINYCGLNIQISILTFFIRKQSQSTEFTYELWLRFTLRTNIFNFIIHYQIIVCVNSTTIFCKCAFFLVPHSM